MGYDCVESVPHGETFVLLLLYCTSVSATARRFPSSGTLVSSDSQAVARVTPPPPCSLFCGLQLFGGALVFTAWISNGMVSYATPTQNRLMCLSGTRATIDVLQPLFFSNSTPQFGSFQTSPKNRFAEKQNCYSRRMKNPES